MAHDTPRSVASMLDKDLSHLADVHLAKMVDHPDKLTSPAKLKPTDALKFEDIMGRDTSHWWQLYIDPKNWSEAEERQENPGFYYDADRSPGFQASMLNAYKTLLVSNSAEARELQTNLASKKAPLTWQAYEKLWEAAIPSSTKRDAGEAAGKYRHNQFSSNFGDERPTTAFGCPEHLATDVTTERIKDWYLVAEAGQANEMSAYSTRARADKTHFLPMANGQRLQSGVDFVLQRFADNMAASKTRQNQLEAIARAVRALHIMHTFSDACGRTNVFLLLPAMLIRFGFGLSLGGGLFGESDLSFPPDTMFSLFNGGFSVGTIAKVLFALQDKGLMDEGATAIYDWKPSRKVPANRPRKISLIPSSSKDDGASSHTKPQPPGEHDNRDGSRGSIPPIQQKAADHSNAAPSDHNVAPSTALPTHSVTGSHPQTAPHHDANDPPAHPHAGAAKKPGASTPQSEHKDKHPRTAADHTHPATNSAKVVHSHHTSSTTVSTHRTGVTANEPAHSNTGTVAPHMEKRVLRAAPMMSTMAVNPSRDTGSKNAQVSKTAMLLASPPAAAPASGADSGTSSSSRPPPAMSHQMTNLVLF